MLVAAAEDVVTVAADETVGLVGRRDPVVAAEAEHDVAATTLGRDGGGEGVVAVGQHDGVGPVERPELRALVRELRADEPGADRDRPDREVGEAAAAEPCLLGGHSQPVDFGQFAVGVVGAGRQLQRHVDGDDTAWLHRVSHRKPAAGIEQRAVVHPARADRDLQGPAGSGVPVAVARLVAERAGAVGAELQGQVGRQGPDVGDVERVGPGLSRQQALVVQGRRPRPAGQAERHAPGADLVVVDRVEVREGGVRRCVAAQHGQGQGRERRGPDECARPSHDAPPPPRRHGRPSAQCSAGCA